MDCHKKVSYNGNEYAVCKIAYKDYTLPVTLDYNHYNTVSKLGKRWRCNPNGFVSCSHTINGVSKEVYLHELVMALHNKEEGVSLKQKPILHINRVGLDNRKENLLYDMADKEVNKNSKKKKRTIELPKESGVDVDDIPTYIWYMKPDATHGERFVVNIGDVSWKTTSSNGLSLKYKLEEVKLYVRTLLRERPDLVEEYSMNGDYTVQGKKLLKTYYSIAQEAGFDNIKKYIPENNTMALLQPDYGKLDKLERYMIKKRKNSLLD